MFASGRRLVVSCSLRGVCLRKLCARLRSPPPGPPPATPPRVRPAPCGPCRLPPDQCLCPDPNVKIEQLQRYNNRSKDCFNLFISHKLQNSGKMFESFLESIPKNRSLMVNDLDVPDDIALSPYVWTDPEESLTVRSDSFLSSSVDDYDVIMTPTTDSSIPLSRAMTDSEIDYCRYRRYKDRRFSCPWDHMHAALDAFPPEYLASLNSFQNSVSDITEEYETSARIRRYNDELRLKMARFFADECRVFSPDDPGLVALEEALRTVDLKALESDLDNITP
ncbi:hypothetical protein evm_012386 [Chilo suppressalis]|nr:hypothetical protein evm_012386 [Chilo suppressalis]